MRTLGVKRLAKPMSGSRGLVLFLAFATLTISACGRSGPEPEVDQTPEPAPEAPVKPELPEVDIPAELAPVLERWTGDLDGMLERRRIRVGVVHSSFFLYFDQGRPRGVTYELLRQFEAVAGREGVSAKRKIVSSKPKRLPPSASRLPVTYHHSLRKPGCGP